MAEFSQRGWRLEFQAPQGPYTNVLDFQVYPNPNPEPEPNPNPVHDTNRYPYYCHDSIPQRFPNPMLQVFPAMSKQQSHLLQMFSNTVAGYDRIWDVVLNVWKGITYHKLHGRASLCISV